MLRVWVFSTLPICMKFALVEPSSLLCPQHQPAAFTKFPSGNWQIPTSYLLPLFQPFFLYPINFLDVGTMLPKLLSKYFLFLCNVTSMFLKQSQACGCPWTQLGSSTLTGKSQRSCTWVMFLSQKQQDAIPAFPCAFIYPEGQNLIPPCTCFSFPCPSWPIGPK